ncbi:hypothetical protein PaeCFBP13512_22405 [Paenibacillus sp. CFBP13512]|uniref:hypothetical protein n=1 Tax=Paenibacillus sp. CFBP13512 TaxID=2184007 RepID=UPI0010BF8F21|nr:hypothetical protein [Paenibacillus sp. CFBP13512]TKJ83771.1 hypothetical protein PaeCFBP13512_22405 [Paenibacillus sp. CFBP13512]
MDIESFTECPHCKSDEGYFRKDYVKGRMQYRFNFDGSEADNGDMYELLNFNHGKKAYCLNCKKPICSMNL